MAEPFVRSPHSWVKPDPFYFRPQMALRQWQWFWTGCVFADPMWGTRASGSFAQASEGIWDYSQTLCSTLSGTAQTINTGIRGRRRRWANSAPQAYAYSWDVGGLVNRRDAYFLANDASFFCVIEPGTLAAGMLLLAVENGTGETATENSSFFLNMSGAATTLAYTHEYGAGTNETTSLASFFTNGVRISMAVTRDSVNKVITFYRDGLSVHTFSYTNQPALTSPHAISIGQRFGSGGANQIDAHIECAYLTKTCLSGAMVQQLHRDPFGPFRTPGRASAGGGGGSPGSGARSFCAGMIG